MWVRGRFRLGASRQFLRNAIWTLDHEAGYAVRRGTGDSDWPQSPYDGRRKTAGQSEGDVTVMTTTDTAAASQATVKMRLALVAVTSLIGLGLAGCETSSNLFGSSGTVSPELAASQPQPQPAQKFVTQGRYRADRRSARSGGRQLSAQLTSAVEKQRIGVAKGPADKSDYTLRGYMVAARGEGRRQGLLHLGPDGWGGQARQQDHR